MKRFLKAVLHGKNKQLPFTFKSLPDVVTAKAEASMLNFM